jgi:hypothetical protein
LPEIGRATLGSEFQQVRLAVVVSSILRIEQWEGHDIIIAILLVLFALAAAVLVFILATSAAAVEQKETKETKNEGGEKLPFTCLRLLLVHSFFLLSDPVVGGCLGAAVGGTLPWVFAQPASNKRQRVPNVFGQVVRGALGMVGGALLGGLAGLLVASLLVWLLLALG